MTNKEKIEEIVIDAFEGWSKVGFTYDEMIAILSKLAEWKDHEFKEYLEKKKKQESHITGCSSYQYGRRRIIDEIINDLFPKTEE